MIEEPPSLPVFIVTGVNFTVEVPLDEYNAGFDLMHQQYEAVTRAIETLKRLREDDSCRIVMNADSRLENPKVGLTALVHEKGTDPTKALALPIYMCLANMGLYSEADKHKTDYDKRFAEQKKTIEQQRKITEQRAADLQMFDKLQRDYAPKKSSKKPKKKS